MRSSKWLEGRVPPVPVAFQSWMDELRTVESTDPSEPSPEALVAAAERALSRSLNPTGRERGGAFDLLAADAMVTYACEAIVTKASDPLPGLREVVHRLTLMGTPVD